jgi:RNA polymerase sigma-70 factor (ECF subfamily)
MTAQQETRAAALMAGAQAGDAIAYAELLTMLANVARRYARGRLGDVPWLDDVVQETLVSIDGARRTYDPRRPFAPWFYAILTSRLIDLVRKERRVRAREVVTGTLPEPAAAGDTALDARRDIDFARVRAALDALPARQRDVVRALKLEDESVKQVSRRLGMSESAVKVTAHRGYRALRRFFGGPRT